MDDKEGAEAVGNLGLGKTQERWPEGWNKVNSSFEPQPMPKGYTTVNTFPGDLEDWFAGQALAGEITNGGRLFRSKREWAEIAYAYAAAMMAERAKRGKK